MEQVNMENQTVDLPHLPQLPSYTLKPVPPLLPWISDFHLSLLMPIAAYWFMSLIFWYIDKKDLWSQYRLHAPAEFKQRNRVSQTDVLQSVIFQQAIQTGLGLLIGYLTSAGDLYGQEEYDIALWAGRLYQARGYVPWILAPIGIDAMTLSKQLQTFAVSLNSTVSASKPMALVSQSLASQFGRDTITGFAPWELSAATLIYWILEPGCRFGIAIFFSDSWQYFWHRAMHSNKWMYRASPPSPCPTLHFPPPPPILPQSLNYLLTVGNMHAHHHKIYVPYAFGAFYNTLSEAFLLDTIGTTLSLMLSGLTIRQTMCFSTISVMKGVDDHCGYKLPWDPLQWGNEQNTQFHDIHHQSWGIKVSFLKLGGGGLICWGLGLTD